MIPEGKHKTDSAVLGVLESNQVDSSPKMFYSLDGESAAITYPDGTIELFRRDGNGDTDVVFKPFQGAWWVWNYSLAMNDTYLIAANIGQLVIYNMQNKTVESTYNSGWFYERFEFDKNGEMFIAMGLEGRKVFIYDIETGDEIIEVETREPVTDIAFSIDGAYAVAKKNNYYMIIDMLLDEEDLLNRAHLLAEAR